ncbi:MAG: ABC transporter ATP-binding protein [Saccharofermentanales bacterium]|jgi:ABC-type nitrate/sulfonate/bicarbonate transport system ATPase subunit
MNNEVVIKCENISKTFPTADGTAFDVIADFSIEVNKNEFVVLIGPGQCGKTTLINIIAGLEEATGGIVKVGGELVTEPDPKIGVVYQETNLFPWLTVMGNVEFGPKAQGESKASRQERAQKYIDLVGLSGFENQHPNKLSGGMQQRVGIARVYTNEPLVLLLDEPFGHLDAQTRYLMEEELEKIWRQERRTVLFVTNNLEEAIFLADRIVLMTNCPSTVKQEYIIDLPRPRDITSREFLKIREEISKNLDLTS